MKYNNLLKLYFWLQTLCEHHNPDQTCDLLSVPQNLWIMSAYTNNASHSSGVVKLIKYDLIFL
jgi:hypothetical protein